jgi:hypothetical protein
VRRFFRKFFFLADDRSARAGWYPVKKKIENNRRTRRTRRRASFYNALWGVGSVVVASGRIKADVAGILGNFRVVPGADIKRLK